MIAILIFAGTSKRFWPLSEKSLFEICGTTLLELQIKKLEDAGYKEIVLVGGDHNLAEAKQLFPKHTFIEQEDLSLGMRGALLSALPTCKKEPVLIVSANDVIEKEAYKTLLAAGAKKKEGGLILAQKVSKYFPGGYISTEGNRVTAIVEKPGEGSEPSNLVNIVAHVHSDASVLLEALQKIQNTRDDGYEQALDTLFHSHPYEVVPYEGSWQAVKYPWHLLDLLPLLLPTSNKPHIHASASVHPSAVIEGSVILEKNVRVLPHATIMGPCIIGEGTIVANNALVRGSSIGKNCVIGYSTEVARSILAHDVWTHSSYVGDSILGHNVSLGAGTVTGNLRFDEKEIFSSMQGTSLSTYRTKLGAIIGAHTRTGIHTSISPGVKIGSRCIISANSLVTSDIPQDSFLKDGTLRPNKEKDSAIDRTVFKNKIIEK